MTDLNQTPRKAAAAARSGWTLVASLCFFALVVVNACERRERQIVQLIPVPDNQRTSFQVWPAFRPTIDVQTDVVMVYMGFDPQDFAARLASYRDQGYLVQMMVAVGRADVDHYLTGNWPWSNGHPDNHEHWDDVQVSAEGVRLSHGSSRRVFYVVPTRTHTEYLKTLIRKAIQEGVTAVYLEEPEFWAGAGYSKAFREEWQAAYGTQWQDPRSSAAAWYRAAVLKKSLFRRTLDSLFTDARRFAQSRGGNVACYVPTHSPLNYAHWGIVSPETDLLNMPVVDGLIGQVWTGTARSPFVYRGEKRERTFELAYLEYSSLKNMVVGTGKRLWFLADPVEDDPARNWADYERNYEATLVASLLHPEVVGFEVMPWPDRVLERAYPKQGLQITAEEFLRLARRLRNQNPQLRSALPLDSLSSWSVYLAQHPDSLGAILNRAACAELSAELFRFRNEKLAQLSETEKEHLPVRYGTELLAVAHALRTMADIPPERVTWKYGPSGVGVIFSDAAMLERGSPWESPIECFHALALPLLEAGVPVEVAMLERFVDPAYLSRFQVLFLSYEGQKPLAAEYHEQLVQWVHGGGVLALYRGRPSRFDSIPLWWQQQGYGNPTEALLDALGLPAGAEGGDYAVGKGWVLYREVSPAALASHHDGPEEVRTTFATACRRALNRVWQPTGCLILKRGPYVIAAAAGEAQVQGPQRLRGGFIDLLDGELPIREEIELTAGDVFFLLDTGRLGSSPQIVVSASRIRSFEASRSAITFDSRGPEAVLCKTVVRTMRRPKSVSARVSSTGQPVEVELYWDDSRALAYLTYDNIGEWVNVRLEL